MGNINLENVGDLRIERIDNDGAGEINIATVGGDIDVVREISTGVAGFGISTTSGAVDLLAGSGAMTVGSRIATTGGSVTLTAEDGDLTLWEGVRVAGAGDIGIFTPAGEVLNATAAVGWLLDGSGDFEAGMDDVLRFGAVDISTATGQITAAGLTPLQEQLFGITNGTVLRAAVVVRTCRRRVR